MFVTFLELLSGWSDDGLQIVPDMLKKLANLAKSYPLGRGAIVQLVCVCVCVCVCVFNV